ncbi:glycosyltransferase family 2 protein [Allorhizocola rhizosphaerae]|uniref:glycosyltransferase family 2 protein n=1 Tax=Allorhizocola rhizosphaerae TaxID=1872709 RepID=UPI001FE76F3D|nr:glycosyltransferase family A protein [Allorhizocola rhizosphaerae]
MRSTPISVIVAAYNEAAVIGRCLDSLLAGADPGDLEIIVVANGCTDETAAIASARPQVKVIELPVAGKASALNAGDAVASGFPRIYLDSDVVLTPGAALDLARALTPADGAPAPLAVTPRRELNVKGRSVIVRGFYAINSRLPIFKDALFGRGVIAVSSAGRERFGAFPEQMADDLFLDSRFTSAEKREVKTVVSHVETPMRARDLLRVQTRVRAGNARLRAIDASTRPPARSSWLKDVLLPRPWLLPAAVAYLAVTLIAAHKAKRAENNHWERDESTRIG